MSTEAPTGPTLTQVTLVGRKVVKYGALLLVTLMVSRVAIGAFATYWRATHPPPPPPPTVGFGILPALAFPNQDATNRPSSYRLETATGGLAEFPDRAKVFFMPKPTVSLLTDQEAKELAAKFGFVFEPQILNSRTYRWNKNQPLQTTFDLDIINHHFELTTDYQSRPELLIDNSLPTNFEAVRQVKTFLTTGQLLPSDVATASGEITPLKSLGGELVEAVSLSDADFLQVDLNRYPIDGEYRMFSPEGYRGVISALLSGSLRGRDAVVDLQYKYNEVDYFQYHTYPLRTSTEAWRVLQAGEGFVVNGNEVETAVIRSVTLGYYDSFEEQEYLQPIYVFEGDNNFIGYVPAIDPEYLQK